MSISTKWKVAKISCLSPSEFITFVSINLVHKNIGCRYATQKITGYEILFCSFNVRHTSMTDSEETSSGGDNAEWTPFRGPKMVFSDRTKFEEEAAGRRDAGGENPCRQRPKKMWVTQEELHRQKVPLYYR